MDYKRANKLSNILMLAGIIVALLLYCFNVVNALFIITAVAALALVITGVMVKYMFYRCPHCHTGLPLRTFSLPEYCPYCGERLEG